jgi:hypothetical protein
LETGESYVVSSVSLGRRFSQYFSLNYLKGNKGSSHIYRSLLKYGAAQPGFAGPGAPLLSTL